MATTNGIVTSLKQVPVTEARKPPSNLGRAIPHPDVPRANKAISAEHPEGSPSELAPEGMTVMQQHVAFFDRDHDGVIWPWDTYVGFRRLGFNIIVSALAVPFIHGSFSYPTVDGLLPDPFLRIFMRNMHRTKHGSDSEVFDTEGRFVPSKFEGLFSKYDKGNKGGLSWSDIQASPADLVLGNMNIMDPVGWIAERLEWWVLYLLAADQRGVISKEKIRAMYDGSLWYLLAEENERGTSASGTYSYKYE